MIKVRHCLGRDPTRGPTQRLSSNSEKVLFVTFDDILADNRIDHINQTK